ncbi:MAG: hypothetical protein CUN55_09835 [Phototrophicales bacterium]|nr:MAG: hypothetical protein CUN55_09835 [Phototrophicales bacterium]
MNALPLQIQLPPRNAKGPHLVHPKIYFEWAVDGRVAVLDLVLFDREAIDAWAATMDALRSIWPEDESLLVLHIATKVRFTPYLRHKADEIIRKSAHFSGAYAFVLQRGALGHIIRLYLRTSLEVSRSPRPKAFFYQRDDAIQWLLSHLREDA